MCFEKNDSRSPDNLSIVVLQILTPSKHQKPLPKQQTVLIKNAFRLKNVLVYKVFLQANFQTYIHFQQQSFSTFLT